MSRLLGANRSSEIKRAWEKAFAAERSAQKRLRAASLLALLGLGLIVGIHRFTGIYVSAITVVTIIVIALYSGFWISLGYAVVLSITADYFFIPPIGSIFDSSESVGHFLIITCLAVFVSALGSSLRSAFKDALLAKMEAERAVLARDEMLGVISHELKNPLTAVQVTISLIQRTLPQTSELEKVQKLLEKLEPSIKRMSRLIADLLDVTRLEANAFKLELRSCDLIEIVREVVQSHEASAEEKLIQLSSEIPPECREVFCDSVRTIQILANIVNNAIKFTNTGGAVRVSAKRTDHHVEVRITDNGKGISKEALSHVFDRFWQAPDTAYRGTGLGLSIAKGLVEAQGGKIRAESSMGDGTTFSFTLPTGG